MAAALRFARSDFESDDSDDDAPHASPQKPPELSPGVVLGTEAPSPTHGGYKIGLSVESDEGASIARAVSRRASLQFRQSQLKRKLPPSPAPVAGGKIELHARTLHVDLLRGAQLARKAAAAAAVGPLPPMTVGEAEERARMGREDPSLSPREREQASRLCELMRMSAEDELSRLRPRPAPPAGPPTPKATPTPTPKAASVPVPTLSAPPQKPEQREEDLPVTARNAEDEAIRVAAEARRATLRAEAAKIEQENAQLELALQQQLESNRAKRQAMEQLLADQEAMDGPAARKLSEAMGGGGSGSGSGSESVLGAAKAKEKTDKKKEEQAEEDDELKALDLTGLEAALEAAVQRKRAAKQEIKLWTRSFKEAHNREPEASDKQAIRSVYLQYKVAGKRVDAIRALVDGALAKENATLRSELRGLGAATDTDATDIELPTDMDTAGEEEQEDVPCDECTHSAFPSAVHAAAYRAHVPCLVHFARHFDVFVMDAHARTPLFYAAIKGFDEGVSILSSVPGFSDWVDVGDSKGDTPLHAAASNGCVGTVRSLLAHGASPDMANNAGLTACHIAADLAVLEALRSHGAHLGCVDLLHRTPLRIAAADGLDENVALLLAAGVDDEAPDEDGDTPLHAAARAGHAKVIARFAQSQTLRARNREGQTPEEVAIAAGHISAAALLAQLATALPVASALPAPWVRLVDEASGHPYFCNSETGESSWTHPTASPSPSRPRSPTQAAAQEQGQEQDQEQAEGYWC